jgi:putative ATPase
MRNDDHTDQTSLFDNRADTTPLASRMRPDRLEDVAGQQHLIGPGRLLRQMIERDEVQSMIFWGPPGVGKTTLARIVARYTKAKFINFSAVTSGIKEIKEVMNEAEANRTLGQKTIVFVDEIHRFNKAQQDAFLPFVERGSIILIGATTENPSFEVNSALLSRCKVFVLNALGKDDLVWLLKHALSDSRGFGDLPVDISDENLELIAAFANGDARTALNTLEMAVLQGKDGDNHSTVSRELIEQCISKKALLYDKNGEEHYNLISALHKSMRNSDADAAVYWLARMLEAGEDPLYIARRVVRFASEDVGMADSRALEIAVAAYQACHFLGMPECSVHLTHAVVFCSLAPKSNALEVAYNSAAEDANRMLDEPVPLQIRNAPTRLMKDLHYGEGYIYAHDTKEKMAAMQCLPDSLKDKHYYNPTTQGAEIRVKERKDAIEAWKAKQRELEAKNKKPDQE